VYFALLCGGVAEVGWERGAGADDKAAPGSAFSVGSSKVTHQIVDRPADQLDMKAGREYVQPQWVFDSFNLGCLLPIAPYPPGRAPPAHLSPFVDDKAEGYVPRQREILDRFAAESGIAGGAQVAATTEVAAGSTSAAATAQGGFDNFRQELKAEQGGVWHSDFREKQAAAAAERVEAPVAAAAPGGTAAASEDVLGPPPPKPTEEEEERLRAKALMPKKHKRLLQRIEKSAQKKVDQNTRLLSKRKKLDAGTSTA